MSQLTLFDVPAVPRQRPRKLMHVFDAGDAGGCHVTETGAFMDDVRFRCARCGFETDWVNIQRTEAKRGVPCPRCNDDAPAAGTTETGVADLPEVLRPVLVEVQGDDSHVFVIPDAGIPPVSDPRGKCCVWPHVRAGKRGDGRRIRQRGEV